MTLYSYFIFFFPFFIFLIRSNQRGDSPTGRIDIHFSIQAQPRFLLLGKRSTELFARY